MRRPVHTDLLEIQTSRRAERIPAGFRKRGLTVAGVLFFTVILSTSVFGQGIHLTIPVMNQNGTLPKKYTGYGKNISPPMQWSGIPRNTLQLALVFEETESGRVHWLLYRIPAKALGLPKGLPDDEVLSEPKKISGTIQGQTDFKEMGKGYKGPRAPKGEEQRYQFILYALDARLELLPGLDKPSLMALIKDHVIGEGRLIVKSRK